MNPEVLYFFDDHMAALPIYEELYARVCRELGEPRVKVTKTQISFSNKYMYACVSFAKVRKKADCPPVFLVVTFGLSHRAESSRIDIATEPYPNRWTHHVLVESPEEIDDELMGWLREASEFSAAKR